MASMPDMHYGAPLSPAVDIRSGGWGDLAGAVCARITEAILRDERVILPPAAYRERYGATIALGGIA
jgi:hypothetical protein